MYFKILTDCKIKLIINFKDNIELKREKQVIVNSIKIWSKFTSFWDLFTQKLSLTQNKTYYKKITGGIELLLKVISFKSCVFKFIHLIYWIEFQLV